MTNPRSTSHKTPFQPPKHPALADSYYSLLGVHPSASVIEIRQAYRKLSKHYHPDTTELPQETAKLKFQQLNEAYGTLSHPERRSAYDQKIGYSRYSVIQPALNLDQPTTRDQDYSHAAYLDPTDRPLSSGELFALLIMGLSLLLCLLLAIVIGLTRTDLVLEPIQPPAMIASLLNCDYNLGGIFMLG